MSRCRSEHCAFIRWLESSLRLHDLGGLRLHVLHGISPDGMIVVLQKFSAVSWYCDGPAIVLELRWAMPLR